MYGSRGGGKEPALVFSIGTAPGRGRTHEQRGQRVPAAPIGARPVSLREGLFADDGVVRCAWCRASAAYRDYHDHEWGFPVDDDRRLFEKLCLEGFQAGLSWLTILNKREAFRRGFAGFDA
jgi:DNA-3-methyladenine glycosylase I